MKRNNCMRISICVPIYGTEKYIERCARSLFEQTYQDIEYIFVNDCTRDNSIEVLNRVLNEYPQRRSQTTILSHDTNSGLAGARLTGLKHAHGDYVWFVDSDDYVEKDAVEKCQPGMEHGFDMIVFNYYKESTHGQIQVKEKEITIDNVLINYVSPSIWKCVVRRELFKSNDIYPIIGLNYSEDYLLLSKLILVANRILHLKDSYLYHYELGNELSYLHTPSVKSMENCLDVVFSIVDFYKKKQALKKHHRALALRLAQCYCDMCKYDRCNPRVKITLLTIKQLDKFVFSIISIFGERLSLCIMKYYKKLYAKL